MTSSVYIDEDSFNSAALSLFFFDAEKKDPKHVIRTSSNRHCVIAVQLNKEILFVLKYNKI